MHRDRNERKPLYFNGYKNKIYTFSFLCYTLQQNCITFIERNEKTVTEPDGTYLEVLVSFE